MDKLAIFLTVAFFTTLLYKPKEMKNVWTASIISPFATLIIIFLFYAIFIGAYQAGEALSMSIVALVLSGVLLFFHLKNKLKSEKLEFPIVLAIFALVAWGIAIYGFYQEMKLEEFFRDHPEFMPQ